MSEFSIYIFIVIVKNLKKEHVNECILRSGRSKNKNQRKRKD